MPRRKSSLPHISEGALAGVSHEINTLSRDLQRSGWLRLKDRPRATIRTLVYFSRPANMVDVVKARGNPQPAVLGGANRPIESMHTDNPMKPGCVADA